MADFDRHVCVRSDQDIVSIFKDSEHLGVSRRVSASPRVAKSNNLSVTARSSTVAICKHGHAGLRTGETIVWRIINGERLKLPVNPTRHCTERMHSKTGKCYIITERSMRRGGSLETRVTCLPTSCKTFQSRRSHCGPPGANEQSSSRFGRHPSDSVNHRSGKYGPASRFET